MLRSVRTHQGHLATLVRSPLMDPGPVVSTVPATAVLATFDDLTIANLHLAPGPGGGEDRLEQLRAVVDASPTDLLAVIGDTNTRVDEVGAIADLGLRGASPPRPTWNSRKNRFHEGAPEFTSYFTRWFASDGVVVDELEVWVRPIIHQGHRFHVSDHYALTGKITI